MDNVDFIKKWRQDFVENGHSDSLKIYLFSREKRSGTPTEQLSVFETIASDDRFPIHYRLNAIACYAWKALEIEDIEKIKYSIILIKKILN